MQMAEMAFSVAVFFTPSPHKPSALVIFYLIATVAKASESSLELVLKALLLLATALSTSFRRRHPFLVFI